MDGTEPTVDEELFSSRLEVENELLQQTAFENMVGNTTSKSTVYKVYKDGEYSDRLLLYTRKSEQLDQCCQQLVAMLCCTLSIMLHCTLSTTIVHSCTRSTIIVQSLLTTINKLFHQLLSALVPTTL